MEEIEPNQNVMPPRKDSYSSEEKALIVSKAAEVGTRVVADAYGLDWHRIASWKRFYGSNTAKNNSKTTAKSTKTISPAAQLIIQSPYGQEITVEEIRAKIDLLGTVERVYIRADEGKAYWVRGEEEQGAVELW